MHLKNKISTIVLLFAITSLNAQRNTSSPYSRFGYGLLSENSLSFGQALSNTGIAFRPTNHLNFLNPASFSAIDSSHFIFEAGIKNQFTTIDVNGLKATTSNSNMEYIAVGFPVTRWWGIGMTMLPYSKVGYALQTDKQVLADSTKVNAFYYGQGGSNQAIFANSFKPIKGLSLGINAGFLFGQITRNANNILTTTNQADNTIKSNIIDLQGIYFETGGQYEYLLSDKKQIIFGFLFAPKQFIETKNSQIVSNSSNSYETTVERAVKSDMPLKIGGGISYSKKDKLQIGIDYKQQNWSKAKIFGETSSFYKMMRSVNVGCEIIPNKYALTGYFKRVRYRAGARYLQSNLALTESSSSNKLYSVNEIAGSFGIGLPLKMSANNINLSFEYGKRSTVSSLLPKETFMVVNVNFTLNENWFYKRKIK